MAFCAPCMAVPAATASGVALPALLVWVWADADVRKALMVSAAAYVVWGATEPTWIAVAAAFAYFVILPRVASTRQALRT